MPDSGDCLRVQPGGMVVLARKKGAAINGIPLGTIIHTYAPSLLLSPSGHLSLRHKSSEIDGHSWSNTADGHSLQRDPVTGQWCEAYDQYWTTPGNKAAFGSPGQPNSPCGSGYTCLVDTVPRQLVLPDPGELFFNEIFANPAGTDSNNREWLELYASPSAKGKDLNGLEIFVKGESKGIIGEGQEDCISITDEHILLGRTSDQEKNGNIAPDHVLPEFSLTNSDVALTLAAGSTTYDFAYYEDAPDGTALQLDPNMKNKDANDAPENWCQAKVPFNDTPEFGTPGADNPPCGAEFCMAGGLARLLV